MCCWCVGRSGADTTGLGSGLAEVAGNDCYGGLCWISGGKICGRVCAKGKEDRDGSRGSRK